MSKIDKPKIDEIRKQIADLTVKIYESDLNLRESYYVQLMLLFTIINLRHKSILNVKNKDEMYEMSKEILDFAEKVIKK